MHINGSISSKFSQYDNDDDNDDDDDNEEEEEDNNYSSSSRSSNKYNQRKRDIFGDDDNSVYNENNSNRSNNNDNSNKKNKRDKEKKSINEMNEIELFIYLSRQKYNHINRCIQTFQERYRYRNIRKNYNVLKKESNIKKMMEIIYFFVYMKIVKMRYMRMRKKVVMIQSMYRGK
jgi:hypothetical protein